VGGDGWRCPFPPEADDDGVDAARVVLRVAVAADGHVVRVDVLRDPGDGFGRAAWRCALGRRWAAGRDPSGAPIAAEATVSVRFER